MAIVMVKVFIDSKAPQVEKPFSLNLDNCHQKMKSSSTVLAGRFT